MFTKSYMYIGGVVMENSKISIFLNPSLCPLYRDILHLRHDIRDPQVTVILPDIEAAWEQLSTQSFAIKIVKPKSNSHWTQSLTLSTPSLVLKWSFWSYLRRTSRGPWRGHLPPQGPGEPPDKPDQQNKARAFSLQPNFPVAYLQKLYTDYRAASTIGGCCQQYTPQ